MDLGVFNHLMGENIPEEARIISIADTIDAIVSRRTYSSLLGANIEEIIGYLEKELLDST
jgi:response regulator RpfG family c-di-GMP phosphodiesterase